MNKQKIKNYAVWIGATEAVGLLSGLLIRNGVKNYNETVIKPMLSPPPAVFPVVWSILYALMGVSAARIYERDPSPERSGGLRLYFVQLAMNFCWSLFFFNLRAYGFSFFWLAGLIGAVVWMLLYFWDEDKTAAWLQLPYLLWVAFAGYLNYGVWMLNR